MRFVQRKTRYLVNIFAKNNEACYILRAQEPYLITPLLTTCTAPDLFCTHLDMVPEFLELTNISHQPPRLPSFKVKRFFSLQFSRQISHQFYLRSPLLHLSKRKSLPWPIRRHRRSTTRPCGRVNYSLNNSELVAKSWSLVLRLLNCADCF